MILTDAFQVVESLAYIFMFMFLIPFLTRRVGFLDVRIGKIKRLPNKWWIVLFGLQTLAILELAIYFFEALFAVGWHDPLSPDGLVYDLIFARSMFNVHLMGEVLLFGIGVLVLAIYRDIWLAFLTVGLFAGVHEGLWNLLYLERYGTTDYLGELTLMLLYLTLIVVFWKYPLRRIELRFFLVPTLLYFFFLVGWYSDDFHLTVMNNIATMYYLDFGTNFNEVFGSVILFVTMGFAILYYRVNIENHDGPSERSGDGGSEVV